MKLRFRSGSSSSWAELTKPDRSDFDVCTSSRVPVTSMLSWSVPTAITIRTSATCPTVSVVVRVSVLKPGSSVVTA